MKERRESRCWCQVSATAKAETRPEKGRPCVDLALGGVAEVGSTIVVDN
jgi:hypothetical protein